MNQILNQSASLVYDMHILNQQNLLHKFYIDSKSIKYEDQLPIKFLYYEIRGWR